MKHEKSPCVYIMTNAHNTVLYTGVTSDLATRLAQHQGNPSVGFTARYRTKKLVYVEALEDMEQAILREKQIKGGSRQKKLDLINSLNPEWKDLSEEHLD
ncbi:MAG: GIY-YIG nuclease family protein [Anaerolineales bacterium]|nr:GIY-YIG nuclease family protein [Anaerolineales bacterium]